MKIINHVKDDALKWLFMNLFEIIHKDGTFVSSKIVQKGECRLELQRGRRPHAKLSWAWIGNRYVFLTFITFNKNGQWSL